MPRLSVEDANAASAAMAHALSTLPRDAPQRVDWERTLHRLRQRLNVALSQHDQRRARQTKNLNTKVHPARGHRPKPAPCALKGGSSSPEPLDSAYAGQCTPMNRT